MVFIVLHAIIVLVIVKEASFVSPSGITTPKFLNSLSSKKSSHRSLDLYNESELLRVLEFAQIVGEVIGLQVVVVDIVIAAAA